MKYEERAAFEQADAFGIGAPNDAYAQYFVGDSFLHPLTDPKECPVFMANVTFEPGCRNNWHPPPRRLAVLLPRAWPMPL